MTKEELKEHCKRQVECCEMWARNNGGEPHGKVYEEHKLILDLINELQDKSFELWKESYEEEHLRNIRLEEKIKALEQPLGVEDLLKQVSEQEMWLNSAGYNAYNVDIAFKSIIRAIQNMKKRGDEHD